MINQQTAKDRAGQHSSSPTRPSAARPPPWKGSASTGSSTKPSPADRTRCTWPRCSASIPRPRSATRKTPGNCSSRRPKNKTPATSARPRTVDTRPGGEGRMPGTGGDGLASVTEALTALTATARGGGLDDTAALTALAAARRLAAEFERSELALIEAARAAGATWSRIATAMGAGNRQTAQKRHADLARRCPRPPSVDAPPPAPEPGPPETSPGTTHDPGPAGRRETKSAAEVLARPRGPQAGAHPRASGHSRATASCPEDHRRRHRRGPVRARAGTGPRRDPRLARPGRRPTRGPGTPDLARRAEPTRMGGSRQRRHGTARGRHRQDHHRRQRPHPRCRRRQSSARTATAAGKRTQNRHALNRVHQWWTLARQEKLSRPVDQDL